MSFPLAFALFIAVWHTGSALQYCRVRSTGPCIGGLCPSSADQCITTEQGQVCCDKTQIGTVGTRTTPSTQTNCEDMLNPRTGKSDCPQYKWYCNNSKYYDLMTQQCPKSCNRCKEAAATPKGCRDLVNPVTGRSNCPKLIAYCNNSSYRKLMEQQCPKTCRFCN